MMGIEKFGNSDENAQYGFLTGSKPFKKNGSYLSSGCRMSNLLLINCAHSSRGWLTRYHPLFEQKKNQVFFT